MIRELVTCKTPKSIEIINAINNANFGGNAHVDEDLEEQYRDLRHEQINSPQRGSAYGQEKKNYKFVRLV